MSISPTGPSLPPFINPPSGAGPKEIAADILDNLQNIGAALGAVKTDLIPQDLWTKVKDELETIKDQLMKLPPSIPRDILYQLLTSIEQVDNRFGGPPGTANTGVVNQMWGPGRYGLHIISFAQELLQSL